MPRKKARTDVLTPTELRLMEILWRNGSATVADVHGALPDGDMAYASVSTMMRVLEQKGHVRHDTDGRVFVYHPLVGPDVARRRAVTDVLSRYFGGSAAQMTANLLEGGDVSRSDLSEMKRLLAEAERGAHR